MTGQPAPYQLTNRRWTFAGSRSPYGFLTSADATRAAELQRQLLAIRPDGNFRGIRTGAGRALLAELQGLSAR